jgi:V/A-type H+/Na+-transporting ATPase subunit I
MLTKKLFKIQIFGNHKDKQTVIEKLQKEEVLHIADSDLNTPHLKKDVSIEGTDEISLLLLKLNFLIVETEIKKEFELKKLPELRYVLSDTKKLLDKHYDKIKNLSEKKEHILLELKDLESKLTQLKNLPFKLKNTNSKQFKTSLFRSEKKLKLNLKTKHVLKIIQKEQVYYKITYLRSDSKKLNDELRNFPVKRLNLPEFEDSEQYKLDLLKKLKQTKNSLKKILKEIQIILNPEQSKILYCYLSLENYYAQYTIANKFQTTKNHFLIKGYTEQKNIEKLRKIPNVSIYLEPADNESPTKLEQAPILENFQQITKIFSLPKYGAADPSSIIMLFYPLFFGLMLSDVGYGLLLLLIVLGLHIKYKKEVKDITTIFSISAISSIFFGLLFGSFFGELIPLTPIIADSFSISFQLLIVALIIGLLHINLGLVLKLIQNKNMDAKLIEYLNVFPYILIQIIMLTLYFKLNILSGVLALILIALLLKTKGIFGIMDITGFFGTWFSYARLLALNLATAGVALAINIIANKALEFGALGVFIWLIILILGHTFNFVINIIGVTINSARLHYVEFFSQFFEGGGVEFEPFKIKKELKD